MEKRYCILCGCENEGDAHVCRNCGESLDQEENLLKEYLLKKTKSKIRGKVEDSLFSIIKNWLLSHLYGVVLAVALIAAVTVTVQKQAEPSYIRTVASPVRPGVSAPISTPAAVQPEPAVSAEPEVRTLSEEEIDAARENLFSYIGSAAFHKIEDKTGWGFAKDYSDTPPSSFWLPASYGYSGVHEYDFVNPDTEIFWDTQDTNTEFYETVETDIGKQLQADGYPVAEFALKETYVDETEGNGTFERNWRLVIVQADGVWYIAEDRAQ